MPDYSPIAAKILDYALSRGSSAGEVYISRTTSQDIKVKAGELAESNSAHSFGVGIRLIKNQRQGYAYACDLNEKNLRRAVDQALQNAAYSDPDCYLTLPQPQNYPTLTTYDPELARADFDYKFNLACQTEQLTAQADKIIAIDRAGFKEATGEVWLYNSHNLAIYEKSSCCSLYCSALAGDGTHHDNGSGFSQAIRLSQLDPAACSAMTAERATRLLGAKPINSTRAPLVLDPYITCEFLSLLASAFFGENVSKEKSLYSHALGQAIAPAGLNLIDDATLPEHLASQTFDSEGSPGRCTHIITDGVLTGLLYDCKAAARAHSRTTANAARSSFRSAPTIATTNYYLAAGSVSTAEIIAATDYGLYVTDILGAHTANTLTGDFSFGACGILIDRGRLSHPVRGITISGNLKDILKNIDLIGGDLTFYGSDGAPTVRVNDVQING